jgi:predicted  nucleic acid-binding Zn-ribbon protein
VSEDIDQLWALRALDEEVVERTAELARFPEERRTLEQRVTGERTRLEDLKARLAAAQVSRRQIEKDIEVLVEQERKFQSQLPAVKKNEEYTALLHEIAATRQKRSDQETRVLLQLEEEEQIQAERPRIEAALQSAERERTERVAALDHAEAADRERLEGLESQRRGRIERLTAPVRSRYERVRASRDGRAVVPISKGACGGCFRAQPPQVLQEARRRDRLLSCEGCGRLLIWPPDGA